MARAGILKLINRNAQTVEMLSISPGVLVYDTPNSKYANVPLYLASTATVSSQKNGQIFYNRYNDINGTVALYDSASAVPTPVTVTAADIDPESQASLRNIVHINSGQFETVKLVNSASLEGYVALSTSHPAYIEFQTNPGSTYLQSEFERHHFRSYLS